MEVEHGGQVNLVCCTVFQCVLQCVAVCCSVLQCAAIYLQCDAVCRSVLQCVAVCSSVLGGGAREVDPVC